MKIRYFLSMIIALIGVTIANAAYAVCPLCVVAVGAGVGLSRWLGVDDVISSIWIGGLLWGLSVWTVVWLRNKNWGFKYDSWVITVAYYVLVLGPLYYSDLIGHPLNKIFGIDKILFGTALGTIIFAVAVWLHEFLKKKNEGKSFFLYQKVVIPVLALLITSLAVYFIIK